MNNKPTTHIIVSSLFGDGQRLSQETRNRIDLQRDLSACLVLPHPERSWDGYRLYLDITGSGPWPNWHSARLWIATMNGTWLTDRVPALLYAGQHSEVPVVVNAPSTWPGDNFAVYSVLMRVEQ